MSDLGRIYGTTFAAIPTWLLDADVSDRAIRLFAKLNRYAGSRDQCNPGRKRLADEMFCSLDSLDRAKAELIACGALEIRPVFTASGDRTSNDYLLHFDAPVLAPPSVNSDGDLRPGDREVAATGGAESAATGGREVAAAGTRPSLNESQVEGEGEGTSSLPREQAKSKPKPKQARKPKEPDVLWDTFLELGLAAPDGDSERGRWNRAVGELRSAGATPELMRQRVREYHRRWPGASLTPTALSCNWGSLSIRDRTGDTTARNPANTYGDEDRVGGTRRIQ